MKENISLKKYYSRAEIAAPGKKRQARNDVNLGVATLFKVDSQ
jgi:hypothetical protein